MLALALTLLTAAPPDVTVWQASPAHPKVVFAPRDTPDAALRIIFRAGAADDGIDYGLTRLTQVAILRGQSGAAYQKLDDALYAAGADVEVITGVRSSAFALDAQRGTFDGLAAQLLQHVLAPKLSSEGIERARRVVVTDPLAAGSAEDLQSFIAGEVMIMESTGGGGDYKNPVWGDAETLTRTTQDAVRKHAATRLVPANAVIIVAGAFDQAKIKKVISGLKGGKARTLSRPDLTDVLPRNFERWNPREVHMQLQVLELTDAHSIAAARVLAYVVHERVFWRFRKLGTTYGPSASLLFEEWLDCMVILMQVVPSAKENHEVLLRELLDTLLAGRFTDAEVARAKARTRAELLAIEAQPALLAAALEPTARGQRTGGPAVIAAVDQIDHAALKDAAQNVLGKKRGMNVLFGRTRAQANRQGASR